MPSISKTLLLALIFMAALPLLSTNMFLASIGEIAKEFDTGYDTIALALSAYLIFAAIVQFIVGPLADQFGRKPVLLISCIIFILASTGAATAENYISFLIFRILQGSIATGLALSRVIVSDIVSPKEAASMLGYISMAMSLAPVLGPTIGGLLAEFAGWRSNFWLYSCFGSVLLWLIWKHLPETGTKNYSTPREFFNAFITLISIYEFWAYTLILSLGIGGFFCFITGIPIVANNQFDIEQGQIGLCIGSITCGFLFGSFLSGRYASKYGLDTMILSGRCVACFGLAITIALFACGFISLRNLLCGIIFVGIGNGLTSPSANLAIISIRKDLSASASGLAGASIVLIGALITAITGLILDIYPNAIALVSIMGCITLTSLGISLRQILIKKHRFR